jgi:hypothetical protein
MFSNNKYKFIHITQKKNSYEVEFIIDDLEIQDNLLESHFKCLFLAQKNIILGEETKESNPSY